MDPTSNGYFCWLSVISIVVFYNIVVIIARSVFGQLQHLNWFVWLGLDILSDVIYILDMIVGLKTGYLEQGILVTYWKCTTRHYLSTRYFKLDALSILPFDIFYLVPPVNPHRIYVRFNRLLRVYRLRQLFRRVESRVGHPTAVRVTAVVLIVLVIIHWNACMYALMCQTIGIGADNWVYGKDDGIGDYGKNFGNTSYDYYKQFQLYIYSFYWATLTLSSCADPPPPKTNVEFVFVIANFLIGVLIFASIVGNFAGIITNANRSHDKFQRSVDGVKQYIGLRRVGNEWKERIISYFGYVWERNQTRDERSVLEILPVTLRAEIALAVHGHSLRRVRLFEDCEDGLLRKLAVCLRQTVYCPGQVVCNEGEIGKEMYIVKVGKLDVISGERCIASLTEGGYFGELSLLDISEKPEENRRTASVVSKGYSELFVLSKHDLWWSLEDFPEAKNHIIAAGKERLNKGERNDLRERMPVVQNRTVDRDKLSLIVGRIDALETSVGYLEKELSELTRKYKTSQACLKRDIYALEMMTVKKIR